MISSQALGAFNDTYVGVTRRLAGNRFTAQGGNMTRRFYAQGEQAGVLHKRPSGEHLGCLGSERHGGEQFPLF